MSRGRLRAGAGLLVTLCFLGAALSGCNKAAFNRRELVVHFAATATPAQHDDARSACADAAPHASPEPAPSATAAQAAPANDVRFRVDGASDRDINQLLQCLRKQQGVVGFELPDADG